MDETTKTRKLWGPLEFSVLTGSGIDIGCGKDPVLPGVRPFDVEQGDANVITQHVSDRFDFVFSAHCLEHMRDPRAALLEWWQLVKPGGHLFFIVPDEDLYEQGMWPAIFNRDHKATFTLAKRSSWSPVSFNILDLIKGLPEGEMVDVRLQDGHFDRSHLKHRPCPYGWAKFFALLRWRLIVLFRGRGVVLSLKWFSPVFHIPIDQTAGEACAQIQAIVRKRSEPEDAQET